MQGMDIGDTHFKFFPAEAADDVKLLKSIAGPIPDAVFCPNGGINISNYRDYLALAKVKCVSGSWLTPTDLMEAINGRKLSTWHNKPSI